MEGQTRATRRVCYNIHMDPDVTVIGGGLAGSEAAWQIARRGLRVRLQEMRPVRATEAHKTDALAELVCSNSLKSELPSSAPFLLKQELRELGSLLIRCAEKARVPAGHALAVDREQFSRHVTETIASEPGIEIVRREATAVPTEGITVLATGPLTSSPLAESIARYAGRLNLYFYDAISPIVDATTIDHSVVFAASRYGKGGDDYLNAPLTREEYEAFYRALVEAGGAPKHEFERTMYFEACLPLEELARRGIDTLRFGPMKPVGLTDPRTGRRPWAAVQLRMENLMADSYNLVGFQNHMRFPEQKRVFRLIPGLQNAEFLRYGQIHRNTFINAPSLLHPTLQSKADTGLLFAGQICGVEGYVESIATGLIAGINASRLAHGSQPIVPPRGTACGSLLHYIAHADPAGFQPVNISFGLLPEPSAASRKRTRDRRLRHEAQVADALETMRLWASAAVVREPFIEARS